MNKSDLLNELAQLTNEASQKKLTSAYANLYDRSIDMLQSASNLVKTDQIAEANAKGSSLGQFAIKIMENVDFEYSKKLCNTADHLENYPQ
jgi:hypothetical protein